MEPHTAPQNAKGPNRVYVLLLTGRQAEAQKFVSERYPGRQYIFLSKRELRGEGWQRQIRSLRKLKGEALVFFVGVWPELIEPQLLIWSSVFHRCSFTVLADSTGRLLVYRRLDQFRLLPGALISAFADALVFIISWLLLLLLRITKPAQSRKEKPIGGDTLAYLYPYPLDTSPAGGAMSHIEGFLSGIAACGSDCEIFSARQFPFEHFSVHQIPSKRRLFLFRESLMLSYSLSFARKVSALLQGRPIAALYQRHGRFMLSGVLLSRWLRTPLVLEYNGSETWMADFWDPARFRPWLRGCEEASLAHADLIVVVSESLRQELLQRSIPAEKILVNPNAVDPSVFYPNCGGRELRRRIGFAETDIVVSFVGTFSHWHGIEILDSAIRELLQENASDPVLKRLRFLLVGEGPLYLEMRESLEGFRDRVFLAGLLSHSQIPMHLDAADILVSPHVRMPDGRPFFGSPTKLFEYMAMGKAIIASNLDQLACVLSHEKTAWLIEPGSVSELASSILLLARTFELRVQLGQNARACALTDHTWRQNAERVLGRIGLPSAREITAGALDSGAAK
jgi:glycosyltransferase involved in cell wall biosynthesis